MSWYTLFLATLLMVASRMDLLIYYIETDHKEVRDRLQQQTLMMATDIRKFKPYQDRYILSLYQLKMVSSQRDIYQMDSQINPIYHWVKLVK